MSVSKPIKNVAVVGASGRIGRVITKALSVTGKFDITAISRSNSSDDLPGNVEVVQVDYTSHDNLVSALRGQDFLIISMSAHAPPETSPNLIKAALEAGVKHIMPNYYGGDYTYEPLLARTSYMQANLGHFKSIKEGGGYYYPLTCGFWHAWSLACGEEWYGFNIGKRRAVFMDDGKTIITSSTWEQCGRAVAALLCRPQDQLVAEFADRPILIKSFRYSQRDMLDSLHRVMGTSDQDWEIRYQDSTERIVEGRKEFEAGNFKGFAKVLYASNMTPNGGGDLMVRHTMDNERLGLPVEDLDEATKVAVDMVKTGWTPF